MLTPESRFVMPDGRPACLKLAALHETFLALVSAFDDHRFSGGLRAMEMAAIPWARHGGIREGSGNPPQTLPPTTPFPASQPVFILNKNQWLTGILSRCS